MKKTSKNSGFPLTPQTTPEEQKSKRKYALHRGKNLRNCDVITVGNIIDSIFSKTKTHTEREQLKKDIDLVFGTALESLKNYDDLIFRFYYLGTFYASKFMTNNGINLPGSPCSGTKQCVTLRFKPSRNAIAILKNTDSESTQDE